MKIAALKGIENALRNWKVAFIRKLVSGKHGRRVSSEVLLTNVTSVTMKFDDHFMSFSPHEYIGRSIFLSGDFDRHLSDALVAFLSRRGYLPSGGATVLEIGANIGTQTVYFCRSGKVARVIAVEPDPRNLSLLRRNVADNDLEQRVTIIPCAVGNDIATGNLHRAEGNFGGSSLFPLPNSEGEVAVAIKPMAQVLAEAGVLAADIDFVWMDIEGAEPLASQSMHELFERRVPVMFEYSPGVYPPGTAREFIALLSRYYEKCMIFDGHNQSEMKVVDLPISIAQTNILLLP
ncbi:FkbM family methyltransferase [Aminobacter sp. SR38]|uniref:FkbM family methyltransferase n=1 Tax=Aminobacter sp. SR38 TaxID=2774562 RepID=UPI00177C502A|nr:FkbM family methyltransferase [Aminobacter sp. SR38]QOF70644.1 FkbM family methyltransferase [Aminobacter sp. SR38]